MNANDKLLDNSLESTMNMSQDDIEKLLLQYEEQGKTEETAVEELDLESLLAGFDNQNDDTIQDISELLNKSERNQAVDEEVEAILKSQEEEGLTAYDAMDLFSGESDIQREGFWKKLLKMFKKKEPLKEDKEVKNKKKDKKYDKKNKKQKKETIPDWEAIDQETIEQQDDNISKENSLDDALALLTGDLNDDTATLKNKKADDKKKTKKKNRKEVKNTEEEEVREKNKKETGKKEKKEKNKDKKEKKNKRENQEIREKIKEKPTIADAILELEAEQEEPPHKKKIIMTFAASILIMFGFLVVSFYFTGHANKRLAEEAYEEQDYLECYQLLYGQKLNDSQKAMYKRSECILKTDIFWRDYHSYTNEEKWLEGLDKLTQYVYQYPKYLDDAIMWNGQEIVENTYHQVEEILVEEYETTVERIKQIAELEEDIDYTRALVEIAEKKEKKEELNKKYPDMLPEEMDRISD